MSFCLQLPSRALPVDDLLIVLDLGSARYTRSFGKFLGAYSFFRPSFSDWVLCSIRGGLTTFLSTLTPLAAIAGRSLSYAYRSILHRLPLPVAALVSVNRHLCPVLGSAGRRVPFAIQFRGDSMGWPGCLRTRFRQVRIVYLPVHPSRLKTR